MAQIEVEGWKFETETPEQTARLALAFLFAAQELLEGEEFWQTNIAEGLHRGLIPDAEEQLIEAGILPREED